MTRIVLALLATVALCGQTPVTGQRLAGLPFDQWPLGDGGPAVQAALTPQAIAFDRDGSLLIADAMNNRIRRVTPAGRISTVFGYAKYDLKQVIGIALDSQGSLYLSDSRITDASRLVKVAPDGTMTVIFAVASPSPPGVAFDGLGNLYLTDFASNVVWRRSPSGAMQIVAGSGKIGTEGEGGPALQASLLGPRRLGFDQQGNLLITDAQRVLLLNPDGTLENLAGGGLMDLEPRAVVPAPDGSIYIPSGQDRVWRRDPSGAMTILAGTGYWYPLNNVRGFSDGCASSGGVPLAVNASLSASDAVLDAAGRLYVADGANHRVRRIDPDGQIHTAAGSGTRPLVPNADGLAIHEILQDTGPIAADGSGNVYFAEPLANRVRQVTTDGHILTVMGLDSAPPDQDPACYPSTGDVLAMPGGLAVDNQGNLYVCDTGNNRLRRRSPDGRIATIAGTGIAGEAGDGGPATTAQLSHPTAIAVDPQGNIYFSEAGQHVRHIFPNGFIESPQVPTAGLLAVGQDGRLVLSGSGLFIAEPGAAFKQLSTDAFFTQPVLDRSGSIFLPYGPLLIRLTPNCGRVVYRGPVATGLAADPEGILYVPDPYSIWRIVVPPLPSPDVPAPFIQPLGIRNAASNFVASETIPSTDPFHPPIVTAITDSITAGEILRIAGGCMAPLDAVDAQFNAGALSTVLGGTRVLFDGVPAPLLNVQSAGILAVVPASAAGKSSVQVVLDYLGSQTAAQPLKVEQAVPGVFVTQNGQAAALNQDLTLNSPDNPATPGSVVAIYLTGAGPTDPPIPDGALPSVPFPSLALPVSVSVGGVPAQVVYAGAAPGLVGLAQINFIVPNVPTFDAAPIKVAVGGISRDQVVTLAVKAGP